MAKDIVKKGLPVVLAVSSIAFLAGCQRGVSPEKEAESAEMLPPAKAPPSSQAPGQAPPLLPPQPPAEAVPPAAAPAAAAPAQAPPPAAAGPPEVEAPETEVAPALTSRPAPVPRVLAAGTALPLILRTTVASNASQAGDRVTATLAQAAAVEDRVILAAGTEVLGRVTLAKQSGRVKGRARLVVAFDEVRDGGSSYRIETTPVDVTAESSKGKDAKIAGGAAAAGALIGAIAGGGKGALKGGAIGGVGGGAVVLATRGNEVVLESGTTLEVTLTEKVQID
jgi:uncharacterized protein YcfJ